MFKLFKKSKNTPIPKKENKTEIIKQETNNNHNNKTNNQNPKEILINQPIIYKTPPIELLKKSEPTSNNQRANLLEKVKNLQIGLHNLNIQIKIQNVIIGPIFTIYELKPQLGISVSKIKNRKEDISLLLGNEIIDIKPNPSKQVISIIIKNDKQEILRIRDCIETEEFSSNNSNLIIPIGKDINGNNKIINLENTSHILICGTTGSGKSSLLNTIICSLLYKADPNVVKLIIIDTKNGVEFSKYNELPYLLIPVVTNKQKIIGVLEWLVLEMKNRYQLLINSDCKNIKEYNVYNYDSKLCNFIVIIDEYSELSECDKDGIDEKIELLAKEAEKVGIYLIISTDTPDNKVISNNIKNNILTRITFKTMCVADSKLILDVGGAENLLSCGDAILKERGENDIIRFQSAFVSDEEIRNVIEFVKASFVDGNDYSGEDLISYITKDDEEDTDPLLMDVMDMVVEIGEASTSFIQRRFNVGYARAGRILEQLEERGVISGYCGCKPREVLMTKERLEELKRIV